jgi:pimeloyl-ACP methyl ester carboxylesterase
MKRLSVLLAAFAIQASCASAAEAPACAAQPITAGYGAEGPYGVESEQLANPGDAADPMTVYFPKGVKGPSPVVFFAHGFGPGLATTYADLIRHMVSRGYVVVFSTYPMRGVTIDQRYDSLWQGFAAAAAQLGPRLDLGRVAFVGHSFGAGAVPAMAYKGLVEEGWGKKGAFLMELAPWYAYQATAAKIAALPANAAQFVEVYDKDTVNDHRMAIDLYDASRATDRYYVLVQSSEACNFTADHATPGRNASALQRQYAVSRPFDALADWAFHGAAAGRAALERMGEAGSGYQPLHRAQAPQPDHPESFYRFPWSDRRNPRS